MKKKVSCSLSFNLLDRIDKECRRYCVNRSQMISLLCFYSLQSWNTVGFVEFMHRNSDIIK